MSKPIQITVGGEGIYDPAVDTTDVVIPSLKGIEFYLEKVNNGTMPASSYEPLSEGGFRVADVFVEGDIYFIHQTGIVYNSDVSGYTNGFSFARVINAMYGRIGWKQATQEDAPVLATINTASKSGRYFDNFHTLANAYNLRSVLQDENMSDTQFNAELEGMQKAAILRCLNGVFNEKELIENVMVFNRIDVNSQDKLVTNAGLFVGREILVAKSIDVAVQIDSCTLLFNQDVTFNLYLFKDGKKSAIWSKSVTAVADEPTIVDIPDLVLNYIGSATRGSRFFLGYFQDDLGSAQAIDEQHTINKSFCFSARSFLAQKDGANFIRTNINYPYCTYGLNLQVSSFRDHTAKIVSKAGLFDEAIGLCMVYTVLEMIVYSTRSNEKERILKDGITKASLLQEMNGSAPVSDGPPPITGLTKRIDREIKRVKDGFQPCPKPTSVNLMSC